MKNLKIKNIDRCTTLAMTKNAQSGRSMIEMLGVLAIIGVLSVGGIAGYSKAMTKYRINKTIEQITLIAGNIRTFFAPQKNYVGLGCPDVPDSDGCALVKKAHLLPDEMLTLTDGKITAVTNAFGGDFQVYQNNKGFYMRFGNIPQEVCIELATYDWQTVGITFVTAAAEHDGTAKVPVSMDTAIELCSAGDNLEMQFDFDIKDCSTCIMID